MADAVATQILFEDKSSIVLKLTNISDGTGESAVAKADASALSPAASDLSIDKIEYATDGMAVRVLWDADTDVVAWLIPQNQHGCFDFTKLPPGGLINNAGAGKTGDILFTTVGHSNGDTYSVIMHCRKRALA